MKPLLKFIFAFALILTSVPVMVDLDWQGSALLVVFMLILFTGLFLPAADISKSGTLNMGLDINIWKAYIIEKLRKNNQFLFFSTDDTKSVIGGAVVWIPQAGSDPEVEINSNVYPGVAVLRADSDVNYTLDAYRTKPTHIPWAELQAISYDKIDSVLAGHVGALGEAVADNILVKWAPAGGMLVKTTGNDISPIAGQTGDRKGFDAKDLKKAMIKMNLGNVPKAGRKALIDDNMYEYFYDSLTATQANAFNQFANEKEGVVGRLHGFDIMTRTSALAYAANDTVKAYGSALGATDNLASLCWHPDMVCRAFGDMKPFQEKDNPLYYGDIYSMIVRAGGRKKRGDNMGVVAIVQDAAA